MTDDMMTLRARGREDDIERCFWLAAEATEAGVALRVFLVEDRSAASEVGATCLLLATLGPYPRRLPTSAHCLEPGIQRGQAVGSASVLWLSTPSSAQSDTATDIKNLAGDEAIPLVHEKCHGVRNVLGFA